MLKPNHWKHHWIWATARAMLMAVGVVAVGILGPAVLLVVMTALQNSTLANIAGMVVAGFLALAAVAKVVGIPASGGEPRLPRR